MRKASKLLDEMRRKRGYLLSYHRLLWDLDPELLATYDAFYTRLTLAARVLSAVEKETVWIALIAATRAKVGTIHLKRAVKAGMGPDAIADAVAIAAACESLDAAAFAANAFPEWVSEPRVVKRHLRAFDAARGRTRPLVAEFAALVAHAGQRRSLGMRLHLIRAFKKGATRAQVAETLSFVLLHCGGPTMLAAMDAWIETAKVAKQVPAPCRGKP